jgi:hypothetical protein
VTDPYVIVRHPASPELCCKLQAGKISVSECAFWALRCSSGLELFTGGSTGQILGHCRFKTLQRMNVLMIESNKMEAFPGWLRPGQKRTLRKAQLKELAERGQNWALQQLEDLRRAEREKNKAAYERFKAKRRPEVLRMKWRTAKAALRATKAEAEAEAKRLQREAEELAAKAAAAAAANAEREQEALSELATGALAKGDKVTMKVTRIVPNPRLIQCVYWNESGVERKVFVKVGRNQNFVVGMTLEAIRPARESEPWVFQGKLPRLRGRW